MKHLTERVAQPLQILGRVDTLLKRFWQRPKPLLQQHPQVLLARSQLTADLAPGLPARQELLLSGLLDGFAHPL